LAVVATASAFAITGPAMATSAVSRDVAAFVVYGPDDEDDPTSTPIGTPIALVFIAAALVFIPSLFA
jgi:hypothetical protein